MSNVPNVNQTVTPYTKVPDINQPITFEGDTSTFLNELNSRLLEGNIQIGQINDMVNAINLLPDLAGGFSQAHLIPRISLKTAQVIAWELANGEIGENGVSIGGGETLYNNGDVYGVNASGSYLKSANGTLICSYKNSADSLPTIAYGNVFYVDESYTFPHPFLTVSSISYGGVGAGGAGWCSTTSANSNSVTIRIYGATNTAKQRITYDAEGRWK